MRLKRLERFRTGGTGTKMKLGIPLPNSAKGLVLMTCPNPACVPSRFQLGGPAKGSDGQPAAIPAGLRAAARRDVGQSAITCPYCGADHDLQAFISDEDRKYALKVVRWAATQDAADHLADAFKKMCREVNARSSRGGMFSMRMSFKRGSRPPAPRAHREDLLRHVQCPVCTRKYGVYAIALFCPGCGAPNLSVHFAREVELLREQVSLASKAGDEDKDELAFRILGDAHENVVTAVETYLKHIHAFLVRRRFPAEAEEQFSKKVVGNAFQNVQKARALYAKLGIDPFAPLSAPDLRWFTDNLEKRHVLGHNLGLADRTYAAPGGRELPGRIVRLCADEVLRFAELAGSVVRGLETLPEFQPPTVPAPPASPAPTG